MRLTGLRHFQGLVVLCVSGLCLSAVASAAAPANFEGAYRNLPQVGSSLFLFASPNLPFNPETKKIVERRTALKAAARGVATAHLMCRPTGVMGIASPRGPVMIIQSEEQLIFLSQEDREVRHVFLNQEHPRNLKPSYGGHSVGHWEGATLVIDTIGFNERGELEERSEMPVSPKAHLVERLSIEGNRLTNVMTFEDPVRLAQSVTATRVLQRSPDAHLLYYDCAENPRSDDVESLTFDEDWYKPVCLRHIREMVADENVTCKLPAKGQARPRAE